MKNKKHNHNWTNLLKVFIFALMILMPFIVFMPNAFYYGFNEHAVAQEKTETINVPYETNNINSVDDFIVNNVYSWNNGYTGSSSYPESFRIAKIYVLKGDYSLNSECYMSVYTNGTLFLETTNEGSPNVNLKPFDFVLVDNIAMQNMPSNMVSHFSMCYTTYIKYTNVLETNMSITDSMSYAWDSVWQNDLFSWTKSTAIYNGINTTTNAIGITQESYLADYLTYIILFTIIYVIIDIILGAFTMLTHIFNKEPR